MGSWLVKLLGKCKWMHSKQPFKICYRKKGKLVMFSKEKFPGLLALGIFTFMSTLDGSIVNIALPSMAREMHLDMGQVTWSVTIYLVVISGLILLFGRLGDLIGKTKIFNYGSLLFTFGSLLAGINLGLHFLLFARIIQAIGASMTMSNSFGITSQLFEPALRARAMSIMSMFVSLGAIAGPAIGGFILQLASWSYIFWINVPLGVVAYLIGRKALPEDKGSGTFKDADLLGSVGGREGGLPARPATMFIALRACPERIGSAWSQYGSGAAPASGKIMRQRV